MPTPLFEEAQTRRDALRAAGLRSIRLWVPDTRRAGFADECRRQARAVASADASDRDLSGFLDEVLRDGDIHEV